MSGRQGWSQVDSAAAPLDSGASSGPLTATASDLRVRVTFGLILLAGYVFGLILRFSFMEWITKWIIAKDVACDSDCVKNQCAYRVSAALLLFFLVHYAVSTKWNCCLDAEQRIYFNKPYMHFRVVGIIALTVLMFVIPNSVFTVYAWIAMVLAMLYLLLQALLLLDFSYGWSEAWASKEERKFHVALMVFTGVLYVSSIIVVGFLYKWFGADKECQQGQAIVSVTLVTNILLAVGTVASKRSVAASATIFAYTVWTAYSALSAGVPAGECNPMASTSTTQLIIGFVLSALSVVIATTSAGGSADIMSLNAEGIESVEAAADGFAFFHIVMMLGSAFIAMLLSSWAIVSSSESSRAATSTWIKFGSEMASLLLFAWTLLAPYVCKSRNFD